MAAPTTYTVCGQESRNDPWEPHVDELADFQAAETWLRENASSHPNIVAWYIDREDNDGYAGAYYDSINGELVLTNVN